MGIKRFILPMFATLFVSGVLHADSTVTSKHYVDTIIGSLVTNVQTGTADGTISVIKNGTSTNIAVKNVQTTTNLSSNIATDHGSTTKYPSVAAVEGAISAASPTVSTVNTGTDGYVVNSVAMDATNTKQINVTRSYVKIPIATGAPSTNTPTGFVEVWFQ
jgi:hypothetical protein